MGAMTVSDLQAMERQYRSVPFLDIMAEIASLRQREGLRLAMADAPRTIREWIADARRTNAADTSPDEYCEGYDEALNDLALFLNLDSTQRTSDTSGYKRRIEPPPV